MAVNKDKPNWYRLLGKKGISELGSCLDSYFSQDVTMACKKGKKKKGK
jgi:hypothetical protein